MLILPNFNQATLSNNELENYNNESSCKLMDGFAIFIQFSLCFTALLTLIYKRSTESPQRPIQIWALDASKQFVGAGMVHCINICISYSASKQEHGPATNLCTWYFLNVALDTTLGVLILWCWFNFILTILDMLNIKDGFQTGEYGPPPLSNMIVPWIRQMSVFLLSGILAKCCLYTILISSPWLFWLGEICIGWTQGNEKSQVVFVMLIFPIIMNAIQFWLTDTILKVQELSVNSTTNNEETKKPVLMLYHQPMKTSIEKAPYFSTPMFAVLIEQTERTPLLFPPSKHRMSS